MRRSSASDVVEFLDHPDGLIEYGLPLRRDIAAAIRRHRPELVVIVNHHETWPGGRLNMADHRAVGRAAIDAVRDAGNRWLFPELRLDPWSGVRWVAVRVPARRPRRRHQRALRRRGVASLRAHAAYLAALGGAMADPEPFLRASPRPEPSSCPGQASPRRSS